MTTEIQAERPPIITFHSFDGGTGKTTHVANLAYFLAGRGMRVALLDQDLPAPTLHGAIDRLMPNPPPVEERKGFADYLVDWKRGSGKPEPVDAYLQTISVGDGRIDFMGVGFNGPEYVAKLARLYFETFFQDGGLDLMRSFIGQIAERKPTTIIIDASSGISDIALTSSQLLPDLTVLTYRPTIGGMDRVADLTNLYRRRIDPPLDLLYATLIPTDPTLQDQVEQMRAYAKQLRLEPNIEIPIVQGDPYIFGNSQHPLVRSYQDLTELFPSGIKESLALQGKSS